MAVHEKFPQLLVWNDAPAAGAMQMATDEAMMRLASLPTLRWYRWPHAEITFGYPMRWRDVEPVTQARPAVRRWTGGGIVEHGQDLTIALAVPKNYSQETPLEFYERVHCALAIALGSNSIELASPDDCSIGAACFANPARFDVMIDSRKVAGGAIRRCREGTLYQGSIQEVEIPTDFISRFAENLAIESNECSPSPELRAMALELSTTRYATTDWLTKR
jgi:lipoyl(octanoyl) transferase